jgi:signal transduction histidine kinase
MYAEMLKEGIIVDVEKKQKYYNYIYCEGERLGRLIANVLRFSSLGREVNDLTLEYTPVNMAIDLVQSKVSTLIDNAGYSLNLQYNPAICSRHGLLIDKDAFTQILINLVDNGIKFSSDFCKNTPQNKKINISLTCDQTNTKQLCLSVRDYGPGIAKKDEKHIFDLFYRAGDELTRESKGTGIGLALVQELVKTMGGSVTFKNCEPGAEFTVCLPSRINPE